MLDYDTITEEQYEAYINDMCGTEEEYMQTMETEETEEINFWC